MALIRKPPRVGVAPAPAGQLEAFPAPDPPAPPPKGRRRVREAHKSPEGQDFIGRTDPANAPKRTGGFGEARIQRAAAELDVIIESNGWAKARPIHFVALYARMHKLVYEVDAVWTGEDRRRFAMIVGGTISRYFDGDPGKFADYVRWVWRREKRTEKWRRDTGSPGRVIGWQLQCSTKLINEYAVNVGARGRD